MNVFVKLLAMLIGAVRDARGTGHRAPPASLGTVSEGWLAQHRTSRPQ